MRTGYIFFLAFFFVASFFLPPESQAAETILTGKVMATVIRAEPLPFHAIIEKVCVRPGESVKKGSPLLRFRLQGDSERVLQQEITRGSDTEELRGKILELEREQARLEALCKKNRHLVASGLGSTQALSRQESEVVALKERIGLLRSTIRKAELTFSARLRELEKFYNVPLREGMILPDTDLILPSPIDGYVLSIGSIFPGSLVPQGAQPVKVGPLDPMMIQVPVYEGELEDVSEGKVAQVEIPSLGNKKFEAKVTEISWVSNDMNVDKPSYFTVKLMVPNSKFELKPGFKAVVRF